METVRQQIHVFMKTIIGGMSIIPHLCVLFQVPCYQRRDRHRRNMESLRRSLALFQIDKVGSPCRMRIECFVQLDEINSVKGFVVGVFWRQRQQQSDILFIFRHTIIGRRIFGHAPTSHLDFLADICNRNEHTLDLSSGLYICICQIFSRGTNRRIHQQLFIPLVDLIQFVQVSGEFLHFNTTNRTATSCVHKHWKFWHSRGWTRMILDYMIG